MTISYWKKSPNISALLSTGLVAVLLGSFTSCDWQKGSTEEWVVRIENHYLTREELKAVIPPELSPEDSTKAADIYINNWLRDHAELVQAELNLPADQIDFERQLRDYRNSLVVYAFERQLIKQKLDTIVSTAEIANYYHENAQNFELKEYIVRTIFLKVPNDVPGLDEAEEWFRSDDDNSVSLIEGFSRQYAEYSHFDENRWLYFDELQQKVPLHVSDKEQFLTNNKFVKLNQGQYIYMLKILDFQLKDDISPLELVEKDIRNIIINKRKREFILQMRKDLLEQAITNNEIEYNR